MKLSENKIIEVCGSCETASCWYGEFMCESSACAKTKKITVKELRLKKKKENEYYWSDEKMKQVYGDPNPFRF